MDDADALAREYASLRERLDDPAVHRDWRRARRLGRALEALEPLRADAERLRALRDDARDAREFAGADAAWAVEAAALEREAAALEARFARDLADRDPCDPCDVLLAVDGEEGAAEHVRALADLYRRRARALGWRAEDLACAPPPHGALLAITAGDTGPGAWARLKRDNGLHAVHLPAPPPTPRPDAEPDGGAVVRVTVRPEMRPCAPVRPDDLRIDLYCTRVPGAPTNLRITHRPTGVSARGLDPDHRRARDHAMRVVLAELWLREAGERHPSLRYLRHADRPVARHHLV
ncbi:PCRF domain-containing protein [Spirillospora sp. NPDC052242]